MKLPLKFETASKYAYLLLVLGAFCCIIIASGWVSAHYGGIAFGLFLAASVIGWGFLSSLGAEGLGQHWRRRHDAEMLKEVDRLKHEALVAAGTKVIYMDAEYAGARKEITDWEDRRRG